MNEKIPTNDSEQETNNQEPKTFEEYVEYVNSLKESLQAIDPDIGNIWSLFAGMIKELREKYKVEEYASWHALVGSSLKEDIIPKHDDFPGDDSIERQIERLEQEKEAGKEEK